MPFITETSMAAYALSENMIERFDERTLKELVVDDNIAETSLGGNAKMIAALNDATGAIDSALLVGNMYSSADLDSLTGESKDYLRRITCEIAMSYLIRRRPEKYGKASKEMKESVEEILERFRKGDRVFDIDVKKAAGSPTIDGPSAARFRNLSLHRDINRMYPRRRLPAGRGAD